MGRKRWVTACLATALLFAGEAIRAQIAIAPESDRCSGEQPGEAAIRPAASGRAVQPPAGGVLHPGGFRSALGFGEVTGMASDRVEAHPVAGPIAAASATTTTPWFRRLFVRFQVEEERPITPTDELVGEARTAEAPPGWSELEPPGVVQNLRRVDLDPR